MAIRDRLQRSLQIFDLPLQMLHLAVPVVAGRREGRLAPHQARDGKHPRRDGHLGIDADVLDLETHLMAQFAIAEAATVSGRNGWDKRTVDPFRVPASGRARVEHGSKAVTQLSQGSPFETLHIALGQPHDSGRLCIGMMFVLAIAQTQQLLLSGIE